MAFNNEAEFEEALIQLLTTSCGWEKTVLEYRTEKELLKNWADILFENNRSIDRLNDYPLTESEMEQILAVGRKPFLSIKPKKTFFKTGQTSSLKTIGA